MKKIGIYLERKPNSGGAYQYCLAMLKSLSELPTDKYEVTAYVMYHEWEAVTLNLGLRTVYAMKNGFEKVVYHLCEKLFKVETCRKICPKIHPFGRAMKKDGIDYCIYPCADKISFMMTVPAIVSVFDLMHRYLTDFPEISSPEIYAQRERSYSNIARYASLILTDSRVGCEQMIECYKEFLPNPENVVSLPYIAPDYVFDRAKKKKLPTLAQFGKYIYYPAQFWKHKNHANLLKAIAELKDRDIQVNLVCSGTSKNGYDETLLLIRELGLEWQVQILGYVDNEEVVALYQNARALVMPTYGGPTNIPQLEAFALECPVATSRIFGIPEQVGNAALLFDPGDVDEIADCIERLWRDDALCKNLINKGKKKTAEWGQKQFKEKLEKYLSSL